MIGPKSSMIFSQFFPIFPIQIIKNGIFLNIRRAFWGMKDRFKVHVYWNNTGPKFIILKNMREWYYNIICTLNYVQMVVYCDLFLLKYGRFMIKLFDFEKFVKIMFNNILQ